jgi:hypothetical protein
MNEQNALRNVEPIMTQQESCLSQILDKSDFDKIINLKNELQDTWVKKQIFRTETEMRVSVLNDAKHPTNASKYWQCIREQNVFFENLMTLSFEYRKNDVQIKKIKKRIEEEQDDLEKELLQIELEEKMYSKSSMELVAKDRIREIDLWSKLKSELDDGSFDNKNVNVHQMESLQKQLENRAKTLTSGSSQAEVVNVLGPLSTITKLNNEKNILSEKKPKNNLSSGS